MEEPLFSARCSFAADREDVSKQCGCFNNRRTGTRGGGLVHPVCFLRASLAKCSISLLRRCWSLKGSKWDEAFSHLSFCHHTPLEELLGTPRVIKWAVQPFGQVRNLSNRACPEMEMQIPFLSVYVQWRTSVWTLQLLGELPGSLPKLWKWYCAFSEGGGRGRELVWQSLTLSLLCNSCDVRLTVHKHCYWKYILPLIATTALTDSNYPSFSGTIKSPLIQDLCSYSI